MALYTLRSQEEIDNMLNAPRYNPNSQEVYNAIGQDAGETANANNDNFFVKRAKSLENAIGTTLAAPVSFMNDQLQNVRTQTLLDEGNTKLNDIYKKYGYGNADDYYTATNQEKDDIFRKYGVENEGDYWSKRYDAKMNNDEATIAALDQERADIIARMSEADANRINYLDNIQRELVNQSQANVDTMRQNADDYRDYVENNYVSQKINQDRGKFLGSAMNTLSTASDVLLPGAGVAFNAAQGAWEGVADELEQNGSENFDWDRAKNNAISGAVTGGVVGAVNKGLSGALAKNGGNLFKGGNKLTGKLNELGSKTALGRGVSTIATGAGRGAISGAVGGATGAGVQSIRNNADFGESVQNALQGAVQGAQSGAFTGSIMAGANMAANKIPGVKNVLQGANEAAENWKNSGGNTVERWKNTWNSGDSVVANTAKKIPGVVESVADRFKNVGGSVEDINPSKLPKDIKGMQINDNMNGGVNDSAETELYRMLNGEPETEVEAPTKATTKAKPTQMATDPWDRLAQESGYKSYDDVVQKFMEANPGANVDAGSVTTWLDENPGDWNPNMGSELGLEATATPNAKDVDTQDLKYGESQFGTKKKTLREKVGLALERSQVNATRKETRDIGIQDAGELVDRVRQKTGLTDITDQAQFAQELTGSKNALLDRIQNDALTATSNGKPRTIDLSDLSPKIQMVVDDAPDTLITAKQKEQILTGIKRELSNPGVPVIQKANNMRASASELYTKNAKTPSKSDVAEAKIYSQVADLIDDKTYAAIPKKNVDYMYDTAISEAQGRAKQLRAQGNKDGAEAYTRLANNLSNTDRTIQNFRSAKKDFVDINKLATKTSQGNTAWNNNTLTVGTAVTAAALSGGNPLVAVPAAAAAKLLAPAIGEATTKGAAKLGGKLVDWGKGAKTTSGKVATTTPTVTNTDYNPATQIYNAIGRTIGENTGQDIVAANATPEASAMEGTVSTPGYNTSSTDVYNTFYGGQNNYSTSTTPTAGQRWANTLSRAMEMALNDGDYDAFQEIYSMYQQAQTALNKSANTAEVTKLTDKQRQANAAARALNDFEQVKPNFGYDVSDIPGLNVIANFGGNEYQSKAEALALQVGYMLSGATVNKDEAKKIGMSYVPQPRDSRAVREAKLRQLKGIISDYQRTYAE